MMISVNQTLVKMEVYAWMGSTCTAANVHQVGQETTVKKVGVGRIKCSKFIALGLS